MLRGTFRLHDIRDVEAFCERAIQRSGLTEFGYLDAEDLLSELVVFCWKLSADFDPARASFSTFAGSRVSRFIVDWKRSEYRTRWTFKDRVHERPRPSFVGLEHRPDEADPASALDAGSGGLSDLLGLQRARGGRDPRASAGDDQETARVAA